MPGRGGRRVVITPTMIGTISVLIVVLTVFLAYNANSGLPFVSTYRISVQVPNASTLVRGNEVRIGGVRVGLVESVEPIAEEDGEYSARLNLSLDTEVAPIPTDSTVIVRARSALGLKYLQITRGTSDEGYPEGGTIPASAARPEPVEYDEVLSTFDTPTRQAIRRSLAGFGGALAGRGVSLNAAIGNLPDLLQPLQPVMRTLASRRTELGRFFRAGGAAAAEVAPVAPVQAEMFVVLDQTFTAMASVARPYIQETISRTDPTLATANENLPRIRPFLANTADFFGDLQPAARTLARTAPTIESALVAGTPAVKAAPLLNEQLPPTARSLLRFNDNPDVRGGLRGLIRLNEQLTPTLRFITPAQSVCNYASILFRNAASSFQLGDGRGTWQRFLVFQTAEGPNNEGMPSSGPASGGGSAGNFLHVNPYPNTAAPGQTRECEAGNEPYIAGRQMIGNVPGNQGTVTEKVK
jgi:virulence factor Mce-like protein